MLPLHQSGSRARRTSILPEPAHGTRDNGGMPSDEVDRIVQAWERERPDIDFAPLQVLSRVARLAKHLDRARRSAFATSGLEPWEFDVLAALRRAGSPYQLSPKSLLQQTLVSSGTMTNRIDRLVTRGLVERRTDPQRRARCAGGDDGSRPRDRRRRDHRTASRTKRNCSRACPSPIRSG